jgi:hydroxymethylpyrimidine pyrophosphatase-like HAD family hydrolase
MDNGGKFTLATGRMMDFIQERGMGNVINAPASLGNGSVVYDYATDTVLRSRTLDFTIGEYLEALGDCHTIPTSYHVVLQSFDFVRPNTKAEFPPELMAHKAIKIVCRFADEATADQFKQLQQNNPFFAHTYISKSYGTLVEFNNEAATKGHAIRYIKAFLGDIHTSIGIGDYQNDIPLLEHADIGVAVANAHESVKNVAQWNVCANTEGSMWELVRKIEEIL